MIGRMNMISRMNRMNRMNMMGMMNMISRMYLMKETQYVGPLACMNKLNVDKSRTS